MFFVTAFLPTIVETENSVTVKVWWIYPPQGAKMPVATRTIACLVGESLETFTSNC